MKKSALISGALFIGLSPVFVSAQEWKHERQNSGGWTSLDRLEKSEARQERSADSSSLSRDPAYISFNYKEFSAGVFVIAPLMDNGATAGEIRAFMRNPQVERLSSSVGGMRTLSILAENKISPGDIASFLQIPAIKSFIATEKGAGALGTLVKNKASLADIQTILEDPAAKHVIGVIVHFGQENVPLDQIKNYIKEPAFQTFVADGGLAPLQQLMAGGASFADFKDLMKDPGLAALAGQNFGAGARVIGTFVERGASVAQIKVLARDENVKAFLKNDGAIDALAKAAVAGWTPRTVQILAADKGVQDFVKTRPGMDMVTRFMEAKMPPPQVVSFVNASALKPQAVDVARSMPAAVVLLYKNNTPTHEIVGLFENSKFQNMLKTNPTASMALQPLLQAGASAREIKSIAAHPNSKQILDSALYRNSAPDLLKQLRDIY